MNRLIRTRLFVALSIVASVTALAFSATRPVITAEAAVPVPAEPIPVLPTIVVNAPVELPVLPLVVVRPTAAEREAALAMELPLHASLAGGGSNLVGDLLPRARLDMPYYSFGKLMPKASKD